MEYKQNDNFIVIKLDENEKINEKVTDVCVRKKISCGVVHSVIGAVKQIELILGRGIQEIYTQHFEINGNGNISLFRGKPKLHLHLVCGNDQTVKMGHLVEATVTVFLEVIIQKLEGLETILSKEKALKKYPFLKNVFT